MSARVLFGLAGTLAMTWHALVMPAQADVKRKEAATRGDIAPGDGDFVLRSGKDVPSTMKSDEHKRQCKALESSYLQVKSQKIERGRIVIVRPQSPYPYVPGGERTNRVLSCSLGNVDIRMRETPLRLSCSEYRTRSEVVSLNTESTIRVVSNDEIEITMQQSSTPRSFVRCPS